jgi:hypothetical protein
MSGKYEQVYVTDHALIRYIERVHGIDLEDIRAEVARVCERAAGVSGNVTIRSDGHFFECRDGAVVTVTPPGYNRTKRRLMAEEAAA